MHVRSAKERLQLSTHSTQSRTRYASIDTQTSERKVKAAGFSFQQPQSVQYLNQSYRTSARQADPVPITASSVFSSLLGYAGDLTPEKKFHRGVDPPNEKPPTLTSLFRLQEEEAEGFDEMRVRQGIELSRQTQKSMQKSKYEVDAPPVTNLMVLPEFHGQGLEKEQWKLPNKGQELDQSSNSEADAGSFKSLDSMGELGRSEFLARFLERDDHPFSQESIASLEASLQTEEDMFDASQELRDAQEQLENLDHAGAVINSFNRMMEQTKLKPRRSEYAMYKGMPSLRSFGSISAELMEDVNLNDNLALKAFIQNMMLSIENDLLPVQAKLTDIFKWSEKDNIDKVVRSRFRKKDGDEKSSALKRVSRADVLFTLNKCSSLPLPAVASGSRLTAPDSNMMRERFLGTVSHPNFAEVAGTPSSYKSVHLDSKSAEQQQKEDAKDIVVASSSLTPEVHGLDVLSTSTSLLLSTSVTLPSADEIGIRQHSKSAAIGTFGSNSLSQDSLAVPDVAPKFAQQDMRMVADVLKVGKVVNARACNDVEQERLKSETNHTTTGSGSAVNKNKKKNIEGKKVKRGGQASDLLDGIGQRTCLASTNHSRGNDEEVGAEKNHDSTQTALPVIRVSLMERQPSRERKASEVGIERIASIAATSSANSTIDEIDYTDEIRPAVNPPSLTMAEPTVDVNVSDPHSLKLLIVTQTDGNEDRALKSKHCKEVANASARILSSKRSKNNDKAQQKSKDVKSGRRGRSTSSSEHRGLHLNGSRDNSMPDNGRRSKRASQSGPQKVKPDFVTAFNKSLSFRQADLDRKETKPAPAQGKADDASFESLHLAPSLERGVAIDDDGQGNETLPASGMYNDDPFKSLSISPEEVLAALMRGGAARKAQTASPVVPELKSEASQPSRSSMPAQKAAKNETKRATRTARASIPVAEDGPNRKSGNSSAVPSNATSARSPPKSDNAVTLETRRSRSLKGFKSKRSTQRTTSPSSDDDSIKFIKPTFRKAPSRRSISQPNILARNAHALSNASSAGDDKRSPVRPSTSPLKAQVNGRAATIPVSAYAKSKTERLRRGGSQVDKHSATPSTTGISNRDSPEPQINIVKKSSKTINADVKVGKMKTKSATSPKDRAHKSRERSIRISRSPSRNTNVRS
jgi:hypothetical protein